MQIAAPSDGGNVETDFACHREADRQIRREERDQEEPCLQHCGCRVSRLRGWGSVTAGAGHAEY